MFLVVRLFYVFEGFGNPVYSTKVLKYRKFLCSVMWQLHCN